MPENSLATPFFKYAVQEQATDLHICVGTPPLIRRDNRLLRIPDAPVMTADLIDDILDSLINETQKEKLCEHKTLDFSFYMSDMGRCRANIFSQRGSYAIVIRLLPFNIPVFSELGLPPVVETFTDKPGGLFLVTGATGCGKSTTLASLINIINEKYDYHILTIEDPIEYLHQHKRSVVTQREIGTDAKCFASALRSALREDPNVIMVGELRDAETIAIALTAAETGHLVFSTLHTVGAAKSINWITDAFPPTQQDQIRNQLAAVLEGIVSQQLIPRADDKGRVVACEVLVATQAIRNLIREGGVHQINSVIQTGKSKGMQLLDMDLAKMHIKGIISEEETLLRLSDHQFLLQFKEGM